MGRLLIIPAGIFGVIAVLVGIFVVFVMFYGGTGYQNPNTFGAFLGILLVVGIGTAPLFLVGMIFRSKGWYPKKIFPWERIYGRGDYDD